MNFILYKKSALVFAMVFLASSGVSCQETKSKLPQVVYFEEAKKFNIKPSDMPSPFATESARRSSQIIAQPANAQLMMPKGFSINVFAEGDFQRPRMMALASNGDIFVADAEANKVIILRDNNKDGIADERFTFLEGLNLPFGMAFGGDWFYVANTDAVLRYKYKSGQTKAEGEPEKIADLPGRGYNQHWTRNLLLSPDGKKLYITVGSETNVSVEPDERRAAVSVYDISKKEFRVYAGGLRNPVGLATNPITKELWTTVNERDGMGDDLVPDYVTSVKEGAFYGWPYAYIGPNEEPRRKGENPELVSKTIVPDVLIASHSAALGLVFYQGAMFPDDYKNDAFVALRGSWNRQKLTGYKIIRIRFKNGKPVGGYEDFVSGWLPDENSRDVWGRPVGLLVAADGSLLITDDGADKIWRVSYRK